MRIATLSAGLAAGILLAAGSAQAGIVFSDDFNDENGGATALNWTSFDEFGVSDGTVDIVYDGDYSLNGGGGFVDLDGSTGNAGILTSLQSFSFNAGDLVSLSFEIAGNQRGCCDANDDFFAAFIFAGPTDVASTGIFGAWGVSSSGPSTGLTGTSTSSSVAFNSPWQTYGINFVAASSGSVRVSFGNYFSNDNIGPLLDNVSLDVSAAVPEPATWAMMIGGFGLAGATLRRRRALTARA